MAGTIKPSRPPLALLANDQEWSARSLETVLGPNGYAVVRAHTGRQAIALARSALPDVIVLDLRMPDMDGIEICERLREDPRFGASTPIIVISSGQATRAQRLAALRAGAWDFFTQPLDGEALLLKLGSFLDARRETLQAVEESLLDGETGLYNARGLARRAREIGAEAQRRRQSLACVAFAVEVRPADDDDAGPANTTLAARLADICRRAGRASDAFGRLGAREFAVIAPGTNGDGVMRLVERMSAKFEEHPVTVAGQERAIEVRAGYYAVPDFASSALDAEEILLRATSALRQLRGDERGARVRSFDDAPLPLA